MQSTRKPGSRDKSAYYVTFHRIRDRTRTFSPAIELHDVDVHPSLRNSRFINSLTPANSLMVARVQALLNRRHLSVQG